MKYSKNLIKLSVDGVLSEIAYDLAHLLYSKINVAILCGDQENIKQEFLTHICEALRCEPLGIDFSEKKIFTAQINDERRHLIYVNLNNVDGTQVNTIFDFSRTREIENIFIINNPNANLIERLPTHYRFDFFLSEAEPFVGLPLKSLEEFNAINKKRNDEISLLEEFPNPNLKLFYQPRKPEVFFTPHALERARQIETISRTVRAHEQELKTFLLKALKSSRIEIVSNKIMEKNKKKYGRLVHRTRYYSNDKYMIIFTVILGKPDVVVTIFGKRLAIPYPLEETDESGD